MIIISYKMKKTMNDNPVELILKLGTIFNGIFADRIDTYK